MKFQQKLSKSFITLLTAFLLLLGAVMLVWVFILSVNSAVDYNRNLYSTLYMRMETCDENSVDEMIVLSHEFIESIFIEEVEIHISTTDGTLLYTSDPNVEIPKKVLTQDRTDYLIYDDVIGQYLYLSSLLPNTNGKYVLLYSSNLMGVYKNILKLAVFIVLFLILSGIVISYIANRFSQKVSKPLTELAASVQNWNEAFAATSRHESNDIAEIRILTDSFVKMNEEVQSKVAELEQKNAEKQRFIDSLTHEIRTPLTSIIGYSSLMKCIPQDEEKVSSAFETIHENGERIRDLTENLVRLISLNVDEKNYQKFSLREHIHHIINSFAVRCTENQVEMLVTGEDLEIYTDPALLEIMLSNFIDNAIKAVAETPRKQICIAIGKESLSIRDTGKGIPPDELDKIFEPFYMVDKSRKRDMGGFGMGLAICESIRKGLRLIVTIESAVDIGTKVVIGFPEDTVL